MRQVLCFGDSNTYGYVPGTAEHYDWDTRWTGIVGTGLMEKGYIVQEEGLCGRTTVFDDPLRPGRRGSELTETFTPVSLPEYIPNHHNTVSLQDTILLQDSFPFWSEPIHHQATLPGILHSEILYQSIDLMIIIHIFCYNCYILIFLLSLCQSPFIYRFRRGALNQGSLLKILFYASQLPTTPYQHSPYLLSTGA